MKINETQKHLRSNMKLLLSIETIAKYYKFFMEHKNNLEVL